MDLDKITGDAINFKIHYGFFMDIKKSNVLEDRFKLSSFSLKIYNVNAGNRRYASVSSVGKGAKTHYIANQRRGFIEKYVNIIYALGSAHVKFDV